jgi:holliday junction DNA helicase RuvA
METIMIAFIDGKLIEKTPSSIIVDAGGIGYQIFTSLDIFPQLPSEGDKLFLYTSHVVKEDGWYLYGFIQKEKKELFELLLTVSGIGPKSALAMLGHLQMEVVYLAIREKNATLLAKTPGVGRKTAERIILDLKDKIKTQNTSSGPSSDAISALMNLGYNASHAQKAVQKFLSEFPQENDLAKIITGSLKKL